MTFSENVNPVHGYYLLGQKHLKIVTDIRDLGIVLESLWIISSHNYKMISDANKKCLTVLQY